MTKKHSMKLFFERKKKLGELFLRAHSPKNKCRIKFTVLQSKNCTNIYKTKPKIIYFLDRNSLIKCYLPLNFFFFPNSENCSRRQNIYFYTCCCNQYSNQKWRQIHFHIRIILLTAILQFDDSLIVIFFSVF